jgi:hypothetical protein
MLKGRTSRTIAHNTTLADLGDCIGLRLHCTYVVRFHADGRISLHTGGYHTVTTKDRIARVIRAYGWNVYARRCDWYVSAPDGTEFEFEDGFSIPHARVSEPREWKDGEAGYCLGLVRSRGNRSVPRDAVESYLKCQVASATRDKAHTIAADLARAAFYIGQDKWEAAEHVLAEMCGGAQ